MNSTPKRAPTVVGDGYGGTLYIRFDPGAVTWKEISVVSRSRFGETPSLVIGVRIEGDDPVLCVTTTGVARNIMLPDSYQPIENVFEKAQRLAEQNKVQINDVLVIPNGKPRSISCSVSKG